MRNNVKHLALILVLVTFGVKAQVSTFNKSVHGIALEIQNQTVIEKSNLKIKIDSIAVLVEQGKLSNQDSQKIKSDLALDSSKRLERTISSLNDSLTQVVQRNVDYAIENELQIQDLDSLQESLPKSGLKTSEMFHSMDRSEKRLLGEQRNTFRLSFTYGMSNLVTNGSIANSDIRYMASNFVQVGYNIKTRLFKDNSLYYLRYGFNIEFNSLKPTNNRYFQTISGQTTLVNHEKNLTKSRLSLFSYQIPLYFELDLTPKHVNEKTGRTHYISQENWRFGLGGFVNFGATKNNGVQIYHYNENDVRYRVEQKEDLHMNKTRFGLGTYVGYDMFSIFASYELTPLFKNSAQKQNMASLGLRIDF